MKLSRRQIRALIMEELNVSSKRTSINEGFGMALGIGAAIAIGVPILAVFGTAAAFAIKDEMDTMSDIRDFERETDELRQAEEEIDYYRTQAQRDADHEETIQYVKDLMRNNLKLQRAAEEVGQRIINGEGAMQAAKSVVESDAEIAETLRNIAIEEPLNINRRILKLQKPKTF
jgi:hypothetical protein